LSAERKMGCPTSRAFREVGRRTADAKGRDLGFHRRVATAHYRFVIPSEARDLYFAQTEYPFN